jgi:hypothetical protein
MAEGTGAAGAMGGVAAAATATATPAAGGNTGTPNAGGAPVQGSNAGGGKPTQSALDNATPTQGQGAGATKTWDVKVDGKIVRMTEAEMVSSASLGKAAFKRMEEANALKARVDAFWTEFQSDPMKALNNPALKLSRDQKRAMIEKYYKSEYIDQDAMTPEQRELADAKKWRADKEAEEAKAAEAKQLEGKKALEGQWREHYQKVIIEALEKGGLPKTPKTVGRMAFYIAENARNKIDQTMEQVVKRVEQDYAEEFQGLTSEDAPVEALLRILGPNAVKKLQKYALEQHRAKLNGGIGAPPQRDASPRPESKEKKEETTGSGWKKTTNYWTRHDK